MKEIRRQRQRQIANRRIAHTDGQSHPLARNLLERRKGPMGEELGVTAVEVDAGLGAATSAAALLRMLERVPVWRYFWPVR